MIETTVDGRYQIVTRIAAGGMGEVYRARDAVLNREVAIKVLHPALAGDSGFIDRFRREARAAAMLNHPNIVAVHDWGETDGTYFMVMEFVRGHNFRTLLSQNGPFQPAQAVEAVTQVLAALEHAHGEGIVHRDVKPENVIVTTEGVVKVADFGLARALAEARISQASGTVTGTVQYLAPEQIEGEPADQRTDLYATGIVLYELLVGRAPFTGETSVAIAYRHLRERVPPPSKANPLVPEGLDRVVLRATRRERAERTADARTMKGELQAASAECPPASSLAELAGTIPATTEIPADRASTVTIPRTLGPAARRRSFLGRLTRTGALLVVLAALGWAAWTWLVPHETKVPDVQGQTQTSAQREADQADLEFQARNAHHPTVPAGLVVSQNLEPGATVDDGTTLSVIISLGPRLVEVPHVVGKPEQDARRILRRADLEVGVVNRVFHDQVPAGKIVDQNPRSGESLEVGGRVDLTISRGKPRVDVPDVVGRAVADASDLLRAAGLGVRVVEEFSTSVPREDVIRQSPGASESVEEGTIVEIVVSKGPREFEMPNVEGMNEEDAVRLLENLGLQVRVREVPSDPGDTVVNQKPNAGTIVRAGQQVTIYTADV